MTWKRTTLIVCAALCLTLLSGVGFAHATGYGGSGENVAVCKATSSKFNPYIRVVVPESVAEKFLDDGGVLPNGDGECPEGISLRQYIREKVADIFGRFGGLFS